MLLIRNIRLSEFDRHLAIGLGVGLGGLVLLVVLGLVLWICVRRRKLRDSITELDLETSRGVGNSDSPTRLSRLSSFLRAGPTNRSSQLATDATTAAEPDKLTRNASSKLFGPTSAVPKTQFEIEIGSHGNIRSFRLKRLRSKDDTGSDEERPCRRKLSKKNFKAVDRPDPMPTRLFVEDTDDGEAQICSDTSALVPLSRSKSEINGDRHTSISPDRFTRLAASRTRSASAVISRSASSTLVRGSLCDRPLIHNRSLSYGAGIIGPAPVGPLPALPEISGRHITPGKQSPQRRNSSFSIGGSQQPNYHGEAVQSPRPLSNAISISSNLSRWCLPTHCSATQSNAHIAHSQSASINTWRSSVSPITSDRRSVRASAPPNRNSGIARVSRVSSLIMPSPRNSVRITASPIAKSTPRRRLQTRVSITGSPAQRRRGMVLQDVEVNALPPTATANTQTAGENSHPTPCNSPSRKRSALKSPNSPRKGHRRQNCVRISTLPPMVLGEEVSGNCLLDGILEESPKDPVATRVSMICISAPAEKMSLRPTLSPRSHTDPVKWRASLTPSSPALSLSRFEQESWSQRRAPSIIPKVACAALPRDVSADLLSIPSFHSFNSQFEFSEVIRREIPTPTFELTRPSGEYDDQRKGFTFELDFDESPVQPRTFEDTQLSWSPPPAELDDFDKYSAKLPGEHDGWPESALRMTNITIATSSSSSSLDFPFADGGDPVICSDPLDAQSALLPRNEQPEPLPRAASFRFRSPLQPPSQQTAQSPFFPQVPATPNWSPLFSHPPPQSPSHSSLTHFPPLSPSPSTTSTPSRAYPSPLRPVTSHKRVSGPRSAPARDLRRSIMQLRRMNSDLRSAGFNTPQARRYMKLGREASPVLPFGFGGFPVFEDGEGDGEDGEDWEWFKKFGGEEGRENELPGGMGVEEGFGERRIRKGKRGEEVGEDGAWDDGEGRAERGKRGSRSVLGSVHFCGDGEML